jgi:hypothetical protein
VRTLGPALNFTPSAALGWPEDAHGTRTTGRVEEQPPRRPFRQLR